MVPSNKPGTQPSNANGVLMLFTMVVFVATMLGVLYFEAFWPVYIGMLGVLIGFIVKRRRTGTM